MYTIHVDNVNTALRHGLDAIRHNSDSVDSRVGSTLELPSVTATIYSKPWERVLVSDVRDANHFFHLFESLWILAGRKDTKFLCEFNKRMFEYSDDGEEFNAPYGYRMRNGLHCGQDQIMSVIDILKSDPNSRQAVIQIWDEVDLNKTTKDKACNMSVVFRIRSGKLCMTVYNRSNDMIWGAYGANAVQFSMLQEYVAAHLNLPLGEYTQVTNSYHVYTSGAGGELYKKLDKEYVDVKPYDEVYRDIFMLNWDMGNFEYDLKLFFNVYDEFGLEEIGEMLCWKSYYFKEFVIPMLCVYLTHKKHGASSALKFTNNIFPDDWRMGVESWLTKRVK